MSGLPQESAACLSDRAVFCDLRQGIDPGLGRKGGYGALVIVRAPWRLQLLFRTIDALRQAARPLTGVEHLGQFGIAPLTENVCAASQSSPIQSACRQ